MCKECEDRRHSINFIKDILQLHRQVRPKVLCSLCNENYAYLEEYQVCGICEVCKEKIKNSEKGIKNADKEHSNLWNFSRYFRRS